MMSIHSEQATKQIREIDAAACDANSLWHKLEEIKESLVKRENIHPRELKKAGIFTGEDTAEAADAAERKKLSLSVELAWGVIANAYNGDWDQATDKWREEAEKWRDEQLPRAEPIGELPAVRSRESRPKCP